MCIFLLPIIVLKVKMQSASKTSLETLQDIYSNFFSLFHQLLLTFPIPFHQQQKLNGNKNKPCIVSDPRKLITIYETFRLQFSGKNLERILWPSQTVFLYRKFGCSHPDACHVDVRHLDVHPFINFPHRCLTWWIVSCWCLKLDRHCINAWHYDNVPHWC